MSVGINIKQMRKERGMTQKELAEAIGITPSQVSNIEAGKRDTSNERMASIASALNCSVADLYDEEDKIHLEDDWIILLKEMKKEGLDPEKVKKWVRIARQFEEGD